ncbi:Protein bric-a-brac 2 [Nymphon striatum]|nr:Protein bric-a-brac 2 [Nymphon striatum]
MFSIMLKSGVGHPGHLRMVAQQFCLRWNNHHVNMLDVFDTLYNSELLVDVTLACEGVSIKAHKVVLSACSSFFQEIFTNNPCKHPVVILKGMKLEELRAVLQFMYRGEVNVTQEQLPSLVKAAESLRVKGLAEMNSNQFEPSNFNTHEPLRDKVHKTQRIHNSSIHNSAIHNSSMRNSVQEPETVSPSTSNCVKSRGPLKHFHPLLEREKQLLEGLQKILSKSVVADHLCAKGSILTHFYGLPKTQEKNSNSKFVHETHSISLEDV